MYVKEFLFLAVLLLAGCKKEVSIQNSTSGFATINGVDHYYSISGKGDTLVILHGGPGLSHWYMKPQIDSLLSAEFTLLYYDQRGSGWSGGEKDTTRLNMKTFVEDLEQLRKHIKISKLNLLGHSFGGLLAMYYGIKYPDNLKSLILVDPDAASYELRTPYQRKMIRERINEQQWNLLDSISASDEFKNYDPASYTSYYKTFLTSYFANPEDTAELYLGFDTISIKKIAVTSKYVRGDLGKYDIHDHISVITCPTLILQGRESVFSVEGAEGIHNKLPNSTLHIFENCGHFEYIESPEKFMRSIIVFYK